MPTRSAPGSRLIRDWTEQHYDFAGYVTGFDPAEFADRERASRRARLPPRRAGVHRHRGRVRRRRRSPAARHRGVSRGEAARSRRCAWSSSPARESISRRFRGRTGSRSARTCTTSTATSRACDLAVVQGGLTTTMELAANRRPFLYFPLRHHFEQNHHVRHRLERYGAGRCMDFDDRDARGDRGGDRRGDRPRDGLPTRRVGRSSESRRADRGAHLITESARAFARSTPRRRARRSRRNRPRAWRRARADASAASAFCTFVAGGRRCRRR